ncbi:uncharacterized protein LOC123312776 [Coccinella septempunctata]|uniref:uncharacterized protein LOC123312776 n=1 Tax=Coccinella septempunctata TaxID=41139 RepID=UPI001D066CC5|nr:uncharacterized protein LOC123312776 [Coccinella septempunctata]
MVFGMTKTRVRFKFKPPRNKYCIVKIWTYDVQPVSVRIREEKYSYYDRPILSGIFIFDRWFLGTFETPRSSNKLQLPQPIEYCIPKNTELLPERADQPFFDGANFLTGSEKW